MLPFEYLANDIQKKVCWQEDCILGKVSLLLQLTSEEILSAILWAMLGLGVMAGVLAAPCVRMAYRTPFHWDSYYGKIYFLIV